MNKCTTRPSVLYTVGLPSAALGLERAAQSQEKPIQGFEKIISPSPRQAPRAFPPQPSGGVPWERTVSTVLLLLLAFAGTRAQGGSYDWTGKGDQKSWSDVRNWSANSYPGETGNDDEASVARLPGGPVAAVLQERITLAKLTLREGVRLSGERITVTEQFQWTGGTIMNSIEITPLAKMVVNGSDEKELEGPEPGGILENAGSATVSGAGPISLGNAAQIRNTGTWMTQGNVLFSGDRCCLAPDNGFYNFARVVISASETTFDRIGFIDSGVVEVNGGRLVLKSGNHSFSPGVRFTGLGRTVLKEVIAHLVASGEVQIDAGHTVELANGGIWEGTATLTGGGSFSWSGGTLRGKITVAQGNALEINGPDEKVLEGPAPGGVLENAGLATVSGAGPISLGNAAQIRNTGTWMTQGNVLFSGDRCCVAPDNQFYNFARVVISASETTFDRIGFIDSGIVEVNGGRLVLETGNHSFSPGVRFTGLGRTVLRDVSASVATSGEVRIDAGHTIELASRARWGGTATLTGGGTFLWSGGTLSGKIAIAGGTALEINGPDEKDLEGPNPGGVLENAGLATVSGAGRIWLGSTAVITNSGTWFNQKPVVFQGDICCTAPNRFDNTGTFVVSVPGGTATEIRGVFFNNAGTVESRSGSLSISVGDYSQTSGKTILNGGQISSTKPAQFLGGSLFGVGLINADVVSAAQIHPGVPLATPAGALNIVGNLTLLSGGELQFELGGYTPIAQFNVLQVTGKAQLRGNLSVSLLNPFQNQIINQARFTLVSAGSVSGNFENATTGARLPTTDGSGHFLVAYSASSVVLEDFQEGPLPPTITRMNASPQGLVLDWTDLGPRDYTVETIGTLLNGVWIPVAGPAWPIHTNTVLLPLPAQSPAFYRVKVR